MLFLLIRQSTFYYFYCHFFFNDEEDFLKIKPYIKKYFDWSWILLIIYLLFSQIVVIIKRIL